MFLLLLLVKLSVGKLLPPNNSAQELFRKTLRSKPSFAFTDYLICDRTDVDGGAFAMSVVLQENGMDFERPNVAYFYTDDCLKLSPIQAKMRFAILKVESIHQVKDVMENSERELVTNRFRRFVLIINRFQAEDFEVIIPTFEFLWKCHIWNSNIFFIYNGTVHDLIYNRFSKSLIALNASKTLINQFDKFRNLHRHRIPVSMMSDYPRSEFINGQYNGNYVRILKELGRLMNADFVIKHAKQFADGVKSVMRGDTEFCFIGQFYGIHSNVKYTEPFKRDDLVLVVLSAEKVPQFMKFILLFEPTSWLILTVLILGFFVIFMLIERKYPASLALYTFAILLGIGGVVKYEKLKLLSRVFLISLTFFAIIVSNLFSSAILGNMIAQSYLPELDTLQELKARNMCICSVAEIQHMVPDEFKDQLVLLPRADLRIRFESKDPTCAYAFMLSYASNLVKIDFKETGTKNYHIMKETFMPGYESFMFRKASPYIYKVDELLKQIEESGLFLYQEIVRVKENARSITSVSDFVSLNLYHLSPVMLILLTGYVLSFLVFLLEVITYKLKNQH